ncbi:MAG: M43 family zinc metalloprotease [Flavobacteriales bacterium]
MKKIFLPILISIFCIPNLVKSQINCGTYDGYLQDEMNKYPSFYKSIEEKNIELEQKSKALVSNLTEKENIGEKKIIPVVVHVIHNFGSANITDADVNYALEQLNKNINRQADNMLTTPDVFAAVSGSANVEFRLAKIDPNGDPTNGIIRIHSELTEVPEGRDLVKSLSYWNSYQYFNIWVVNSLPPTADGNTLLGYAQFPWSGSMSTDGVAIISNHFKNGKTLTHEVGHWLGLRHIWGDGLCGDDNVYDTPVAKEENWGVTINQFPYNLNVCIVDTINPAGEMFMNYMDYSDDNVMSLFTDGQMVIVNQTLEGDEENYPFRRYLWSEENLTKTGTANGYEGTSCHKKTNFIEKYGNTTNCLGDVSVNQGNKNIFTGSTSVVWDWGDGNTSTSSNTPQHTYSAAGTYDVSLTIEYVDDVVAKSWSMNDVVPGYTNLETITETLIIEGTMEELNAVNATNITLHLDDSNYSVTLDTLFHRGEYEETYYLAHYESNCISTTTKEGFITILPTSSTNTNNSYTYSFEGSILEDDFMVIDNKLVADWDFNISANPNWEVVDGISSDGSSSIMLNGKKLTSANPVIFETQAYNLSNLTEPAISIDFIGAAVNSFPYNTLLVSYSDECGVWKDLKLFSASKLSSSGYYSQNFIPTSEMTWNTAVMIDEIGFNDLKSPNVRFKFEYQVSSLANRLYIDNIRIGEESDLSLVTNTANKLALSVYPNPTNNNVNVIFELEKNTNIEVRMYNVLGSEVATLISNEMEEGYHSVHLNLDDIEEGLYFISIILEGVIMETKTLVVQ